MADFELNSTTYTVADYCAMLERKEVIVNRAYQRSDKVWPAAAQSFLIETMLLGYPVPKLSLHQMTDVKTRKSVKEIVDGQQRTKAIELFYSDQMRLSATIRLEEARGRRYSDLPPELQHSFLDYGLSVDVFTGASSDQIREVFRRINSYTVPLNPEEQRHARWQGAMKWFIYGLSRDFDEIMLLMGTFTEARLVRMSDAKLYGEIVHALLHGITTTKAAQLDALYRENDAEFAEADAFGKRFQDAIDLLLGMDDLHGGPLMKPHMMYSLLLAIMHVRQPAATLQAVVPLQEPGVIHVTGAVTRLSAMAAALDEEETPEGYAAFVSASEAKTNVKDQRETRLKELVKALLGE